MDEERLPITNLPQLSAEARALFCAGWNEPVIDLRPLFPVEREFGPAVIRAAIQWGLPPHQVVV
jgi:hypothetical protein